MPSDYEYVYYALQFDNLLNKIYNIFGGCKEK